MPQPSLTPRRASDRIEQIIFGTVVRLVPEARLELYRPGSYVGGCLADPSGPDDNRVQVTRAYFLRGVSHANAEISRQVLHWWTREGHTITDAYDVGGAMPSINGVTSDDFVIGLEWTGSGDLSIVATSPCLWPDGTPSPET